MRDKSISQTGKNMYVLQTQGRQRSTEGRGRIFPLKNMKFTLYVTDKTLADLNGGSFIMWHLSHAIKELGHEAELFNVGEIPPAGSDYIIFQQTWYGILKNDISNCLAKKICYLETFKTDYEWAIPIKDLKADYYVTPCKGEAVEWAEEILGKIIYFPMAGCSCIKEGTKKDYPSKIWIGHDIKEKSTEWLEYAGVGRIRTDFANLPDYYKSATVCPIIHGDFQKGIATDFFHLPSSVIAERAFQIIQSGGFCISDDNKLMREFFAEDEIPMCQTKEEFKEKIDYYIENPDGRLPFMKKAKERIEREHLYTHRIKDLLTKI